MSRKLAGLFCNEFYSDMKFVIEREYKEYPAHKLIIGQGSDVLYNMVYGSDTSLAASTIIVPGYSSEDFLPVLKYLYTGDVEWNMNNYDGILNVGKYFGLTELDHLFCIYIANTVKYENALDIYAQCFHVSNYVCRTTMKIIQLILSNILDSETEHVKFFELPTEALSQILRMDELGINNEQQLFEKMMNWAMTKEQSSLRSFFENQAKLIRFADVSLQNHREFEEFLQLESYSRWKIKIIVRLNSRVDDKFTSDNSGAEHSWEIIHITSRSRTIRLHGLSTSSSQDIFVEKNNIFETIECCRSKIFQNEFFDVMFDKAIEIPKNTTVQIKVPECSKRFDFEVEHIDNDSFYVHAIHKEVEIKHLPIGAIFISTL